MASSGGLNFFRRGMLFLEESANHRGHRPNGRKITSEPHSQARHFDWLEAVPPPFSCSRFRKCGASGSVRGSAAPAEWDSADRTVPLRLQVVLCSEMSAPSPQLSTNIVSERSISMFFCVSPNAPLTSSRNNLRIRRAEFLDAADVERLALSFYLHFYIPPRSEYDFAFNWKSSAIRSCEIPVPFKFMGSIYFNQAPAVRASEIGPTRFLRERPDHDLRSALELFERVP